MKELMDWIIRLPELAGELAKTWWGIMVLVAIGVFVGGKILQFVVEVISAVWSFLRWWRRWVTVIQGGVIVAIGRVTSFGHQWLTLHHLYGFAGNVKCAFCRNRIDMFRLYVPGDEKYLVQPGVKAQPPQSVSDPEEEGAEDEGDDGGE